MKTAGGAELAAAAMTVAVPAAISGSKQDEKDKPKPPSKWSCFTPFRFPSAFVDNGKVLRMYYSYTPVSLQEAG